jgi:hypothetical protein
MHMNASPDENGKTIIISVDPGIPEHYHVSGTELAPNPLCSLSLRDAERMKSLFDSLIGTPCRNRRPQTTSADHFDKP